MGIPHHPGDGARPMRASSCMPDLRLRRMIFTPNAPRRPGRHARLRSRKPPRRYDTKLRALNDKLEREQRELKQDQAELSSRKLEERELSLRRCAGFLGFGRKRSISSSITKAAHGHTGQR